MGEPSQGSSQGELSGEKTFGNSDKGLVTSYLKEQLEQEDKETKFKTDFDQKITQDKREGVSKRKRKNLKTEQKLPQNNTQDQLQLEEPVNPDKELLENTEFEVLKPITHNHFVLDLFQSKSFKDKNVLEEYTYKIVPKYPSDKIPLNHTILHLKALFVTLLDEMSTKYGNSAKVRIFISHDALKKQIIIPPQFLDKISSEIHKRY